MKIQSKQKKKVKKEDREILKMSYFGFCILPLFKASHTPVNEDIYGFINSGTFKLPIYTSKSYTKEGKLPNGLLQDLAQGDPHKLLRTDLKKKYGIKEMDNGAHIVVQLIDKHLLSLKREFFPPDSRSKDMSITMESHLLVPFI